MSYTPRIRPISIDELDIIRDLAQQIWPKDYRRIVAPDQIDSMVSALFDLDALESDMAEKGHLFWVANVGDRNVGFVSAYLDGGRIWVTKLYVLQDYRGFGLGKVLIQAAIDHFTPACELALCIHKEHDRSVDFALRSGFAIQHEIPFTVGSYGFTDYVMHKDLRN